MAKSQLTTILHFLLIWKAARNASTNRIGSANDFSRIKTKSAIISPAMISNDWKNNYSINMSAIL